MATIGEIAVRLTAQTDQYKSEMADAQRRLTGFSKAAEDASRKIAYLATAALAAATAVAGFAVKLAAEWEQTEIAFTTLLGSAEKARSFLEELDAFAARTPFELPGLVDASRKLLAFGFQAKEIIPTMTAVGDAIAALGGTTDEVNRVIRALGQMQAKGKVTAEEMTVQLAEIGIPAWRYLAEAIGVSIPQAMKMAEKGLIPAAVGIRAILLGMTRDFGGAMQTQSRTMIGIWSTAKDQMRYVLRALGLELIETFRIKELLIGFTNALGFFAEQLRRARQEGGGLGLALTRAFSPEVRLLIIALTGAVIGALTPAFILAAKAIWATVVALAPLMIKGAAVALAAYVIYKAWADAGGGIAAVAVFMVRVAGSVVNILSLLIPPLRAVSSRIFAYADSLAAASKAARGAARQSQPVVSVANNMQQQQQAVTKAGEGAAKSQEKLGDAAKKAAKKAGANIMAFDQVHTLQEEVAKSGEEAAAAMAPPVAAMPELAAPVAPALPDVAPAVGPLGDLAKKWDAVNARLKKAKPILESIGHIIGAVLIGWIVRLAGKWLWAAAKWVWGAARIAAGWFMAIHPAGRVIAIIIAVATLIVLKWDWIKAMTIKIWTAISDFIARLWTGLKNTVSSITSAIYDFISDKWTTLKTALSNIVTAIYNSIANTWTSLKTALSNIVTAIYNSIVNKWTELKTTLSNTVTAIYNSIADKWAALKTTLSNTVSAIYNLVANKWTELKTTLSNTVSAIRDSAVNKFKNIESNLSNITSAIWNSVVGGWQSLRDTLGSIWQGIRNTASSIWGGVRDVIKGVINSIIGLFNSFVRFWNRVELKFPRINIPFIGPIGGWTIRLPQLPEIPYLQYGGVIARPTLAMLGEAGPEAVVPLRAGADELADPIAQAVYVAVRDAIRITRAETGRFEERKELVLELDGVRIGRVLLPSLIRESMRRGTPVIKLAPEV